MEETIELRKIIEILLKGKWLIAICSISAMLVAGIISWFVLEEKYESKAVLQISSGVQDTGIMASYIATEFAPNIYMLRLGNVEQNKKFFKNNGYDDFNKDNLFTSVDTNTGIVNLKYKDTSPEEAQKILNLLMSKTKNEMNSSVKETLNHLEKTYLKESESLSNEIERLMKQYNSIVISNKLPEVLILQTVTTSEFVLNLSDEQTTTFSTITGTLQNELLQLKVQIDTKSDEYHAVLAKYQSVKTGLESFKPDPFIRVIIEPTLADVPASPNKVLNLALGFVLGFMIGIGFVFLQEYRRKSALL